MMNKKIALFGVVFFLTSYISALAADKVVVVPLSSARVAGTDGQVQYNDAGKNAGAEVYYNKSNGNVGVGTDSPTAKLEVRGEIRSIDGSGNNRLWGEGRAGTTTTYNATGNGITIAHSNGLASWDGSAAVCPKNTWVCTSAEIGILSTLNITGHTGLNCSGGSLSSEGRWVQDEHNSQNGRTAYVYEIFQGFNIIGTKPSLKCNYLEVYCCSVAN